MPHPARPSDVHRLPDKPDARAAVDDDQVATPRRPPLLWLVLAALLAAGLIAAGAVRGARPATPSDQRLADVVDENQAVAVLALYEAEASVASALHQRRDPYTPPGPGDAAIVAERGRDEVQRRLEAARRQATTNPVAARYAATAGHAGFVRRLDELGHEAEQIALLAAAHDTIYDGRGAVPLSNAQHQMTSLFSDGARPRPFAAWARALLDEIDGRDRRLQAEQARAATRDYWAAQLERMRLPAEGLLLEYVTALPDATVRSLRDHAVAGPALARLPVDEH